jgi:hypothetical protein
MSDDHPNRDTVDVLHGQQLASICLNGIDCRAMRAI